MEIFHVLVLLHDHIAVAVEMESAAEEVDWVDESVANVVLQVEDLHDNNHLGFLHADMNYRPSPGHPLVVDHHVAYLASVQTGAEVHPDAPINAFTISSNNTFSKK